MEYTQRTVQMNDYNIIRDIFTQEEISGYNKIRRFQQTLGTRLEEYINTKITDNITFVGRDKKRPEGVDYIVNGQYYSIKNAWNTENNSNKKFREDRNIQHWYRLNKNGTTNWESLFVDNVSEREFVEFLLGNAPIGLDQFMS